MMPSHLGGGRCREEEEGEAYLVGKMTEVSVVASMEWSSWRSLESSISYCRIITRVSLASRW